MSKMKDKLRQIIEDVVSGKIHKLAGLSELVKHKRNDSDIFKEALTELSKDEDFVDVFDKSVDILAPYILDDETHENEWFKYMVDNGYEDTLKQTLLIRIGWDEEKADEYIYQLKHQS